MNIIIWIILSIISVILNSIFIIALNIQTKLIGYISYWVILLDIAYIIMSFYPSLRTFKLKNKKLKRCDKGCILLISFLVSTTVSSVYYIIELTKHINKDLIIAILIAVLVEAYVFWAGMLRIYFSSEQLGIHYRLVGLLLGMIPVANIVMLIKMLKVVEKEIYFENSKILLNEKRHSEQICKTKYPLLLVHGIFFRDFRFFNYWGRVPKELEENGATIYYGNQPSSNSIESNGKFLAVRIKEIVEKTGCEKVNVIAHSKGGLDIRYAISLEGADKYVASLTTINTPHRGCKFVDYLLDTFPDNIKNKVANTYNNSLKKLSKEDADFLKGVEDLRLSKFDEFNEKVRDSENVYYQSFGSVLNKASGGRFPLNFSYHLCNYFSGRNDGLVYVDSFSWGENFELLEVKGDRGISHGDVIDLNRENIDEFDVREFYVQLVSKLREMVY